MIHPTNQPTRNPADDHARPGKVLIVDDDGEARSRLHALLDAEGHVVETFAWAGALLDAALPEAPCCIVAEVRMPTIDGLELIERLKGRGEPIPVIFLTDDADVPLSVRAIKAGAVDFLPRPYDEHDLLGAVEHALEIDTERRSVARRNQAISQRFGTLTPRERQVMEGVVRGLMNKQIAWELEISEITVKLHRSSLMRKMALRSVPDLVRASLSMAGF
ncbi:MULTISPECIES: response regulator transcription factor [Novosphingobium]|uniref:response regulator transcription factor n=1 Tax=Novosphingobium TaxID=165696 RepID=UPI0022F262C2|nr:response regulator [Novosphingobium resinovorum]GLK46450.1 DNA-binding response regulator [Novosphingobium resinovorum]